MIYGVIVAHYIGSSKTLVNSLWNIFTQTVGFQPERIEISTEKFVHIQDKNEKRSRWVLIVFQDEHLDIDKDVITVINTTLAEISRHLNNRLYNAKLIIGDDASKEFYKKRRKILLDPNNKNINYLPYANFREVYCILLGDGGD